MGAMSDSPAPLADPHLVFDATDGRRDLVILGSTGSIGTQAIDLVLRNPGRFRVTALSAAGGRVELLAEQARQLRVRTVAVADGDKVPAAHRGAAEGLRGGEPLPEILAGPDAATDLAASDCHTVLNGITGSIGLAPTLAALKAGRTLALANKESLIVGGPLVKALAAPGQIIPVDSEHAALFQALAMRQARRRPQARRDRLRRPVPRAYARRARRRHAGAGPGTPDLGHGPGHHGQLGDPGQQGPGGHRGASALRHPVRPDRGRGPPQSYVHSMVEFTDGSTLAQATPPDMGGPIAIGLGWPERVPDAAPAFDWTKASSWEFFPLDTEAFPSVGLARHVGTLGARRPRCSTRPTRSAWTPSSRDGCRSTASWIRSQPWWPNTAPPPRELH